MQLFEYRVLPAPRKGRGARGLRGGAAKFANAVSGLMNEMGADGWEYLRADTLPCEERQGLTGKSVRYHSMLVFRRPVANEETNGAEVLALPEPEHEELSELEEEALELEEEFDNDLEEDGQRRDVAAE